MKKLILIIATAGLLFAGCCPESKMPPSKVVERVVLASRYGSPHYFLLLENGRQVEVNSRDYVNSKVGDNVTYYLRNCEE